MQIDEADVVPVAKRGIRGGEAVDSRVRPGPDAALRMLRIALAVKAAPERKVALVVPDGRRQPDGRRERPGDRAEEDAGQRLVAEGRRDRGRLPGRADAAERDPPGARKPPDASL